MCIACWAVLIYYPSLKEFEKDLNPWSLIGKRLLYEHCKSNFRGYDEFVNKLAPIIKDIRSIDLLPLAIELILTDAGYTEEVPLIVINLDETNVFCKYGKEQVLGHILAELPDIWLSTKRAFLFFILSGCNREELAHAVIVSASSRPTPIDLPLLDLKNFLNIYADMVARCSEKQQQQQKHQPLMKIGPNEVSEELQVLLASVHGNPRLLSILMTLISHVGKTVMLHHPGTEITLGKLSQEEIMGLRFSAAGLLFFHDHCQKMAKDLHLHLAEVCRCVLFDLFSFFLKD